MQSIKKILDSARIPALSMCWQQAGEINVLVGGVADTSNPIPVDSATLFQAASLSKPVSAAIVLDLVEQNQWDLDTPLAEIEAYGPLEIQADPYYLTLTTGMVLGQSSGLPNWFFREEDKKFIVEPGKQFNYSGVAWDFLKEVIEKSLQRNWEAIAQEFFVKVGMENSTFKQLPVSHLHERRHVARAHQADVTPYPVIAPIDLPEIPAGSLLTTATDYITFLQYCFNNPFLKSTLLTRFTLLNPGRFPEMPHITNQIQWGLGMGIFTDHKKTLAFHWGNNTCSHAFCAMNLDTGDCVACFVNSENGPNVFQKLAEAVVGDMNLLFQWLFNYCSFKAASQPKSFFPMPDLFQLVSQQHSTSSHAVRSLLSTNLGFFRKLEDENLTEHRHDDPQLQHEYDKRFGLVQYAKNKF